MRQGTLQYAYEHGAFGAMTLEHAGDDMVAGLRGAAAAKDLTTVPGRRLWSCTGSAL